MPQPSPHPDHPAAADAATPLPAPTYTGRPEDANVLAGLRARRDLLVQQLERIGERRGELAGQLANTSHAESTIRAGLEERLRVLDEQVVRLERDIITTDRQLAAAPPQLLAQTQEPRVVHSGPSEDDLLGFGAAGVGLGVVLTLAVGRFRRWRRRRRGDLGPAHDVLAAGVGPDPRIDRLAHAVDAIAVEVERIGEGQRFVTHLLADSRQRAAEYSPVGDEASTRSLPGTPR